MNLIPSTFSYSPIKTSPAFSIPLASANIVVRIAVIMRESLPALRSAITAMKILPKVLIVDIFGTEAFEIAQQFGMRRYFFDTCNTRLLALITYFPTIDKEKEYNHINKQQPLQLPRCAPVRFEDTFEPYCNPNDPMYVVSFRIGVEIPMADGILVNTWQDLQPITLGALRDDEIWRQVIKVPIYPIGPLVKLRQVEQQFPRGNKVLEWLDMQPSESVIYVSFGSGGTLSKSQIAELAWGLELSQQRFIWVVRPPIDNDVHGSYFSNTHDEIETQDYNYLPEGFVTRTHKMGMLVPTWAPQEMILAHKSVGGFLTHCGWNSVLESILNGVPMIAWPLFAEQRMNATMLMEELGVAIKSKVLESMGFVGREEIEKLVRKVMEEKEGKEMRVRVKELKCSGEKAFSKGGSSYNSFGQVAKDCKA